MTLVALSWDRVRTELRMFFREKEAVSFSFAFPIMMLALFSTIFEDQFTGEGVSAARFFLPGVVAAGVMLTSFQSTASSVTAERDDGTLRRVRSTPLPPVAYFLGKVGVVAIISVAELALLLALARFGYGVELPAGGRWLTFSWVFTLGVATGTVLGVAYSSVPSSARSASAVTVGPGLVLQFISGVYFAFRDLPGWLQQVASVFPLKWVAQGMRSVFPGSFVREEMSGRWEHGWTAVVLIAWFAIGLVLCLKTFRWFKRGTI
jgi:ABC-2 type transport system permease protein